MQSDIESFRRDLVALLPRLRRFAVALSGNRDAGEDLLQSAIERALVNWRQFEPGRRLDSWVFKIMQNVFLDAKRAAIRRPIFTDEPLEVRGEDGREIVETRDELRRVREAFALLPEDQRSVMALVALEGFSYAEAAAALEVPIGTIMSRVARARASLVARTRGPATIAEIRRER